MNTIGIADKRAQKVTDWKGIKLPQRLVRVIKHGSFKSFTSQERAREIMGRNMFGVEEAVKHFGINPSKRELATLAQIPFSEKTLAACKHNTHVLVAVFPRSILDIRHKMDPNRRLFFCGCSGTSHEDSIHNDTWYNKQPFAKDRGAVGWHLVRKTYMPGSIGKTWEEQQNFRGKDEETPSARVVIYTMIGQYLSSGDYRERLFEGLPYVRCSDLLSPGRGVAVCGFDLARGLRSSSFSHNDRSLGMAAERRRY